MSFPGKKSPMNNSFGDPKKSAPENVMSKPKPKSDGRNTMAHCSNIVAGEVKEGQTSVKGSGKKGSSY